MNTEWSQLLICDEIFLLCTWLNHQSKQTFHNTNSYLLSFGVGFFILFLPFYSVCMTTLFLSVGGNPARKNYIFRTNKANRTELRRIFSERQRWGRRNCLWACHSHIRWGQDLWGQLISDGQTTETQTFQEGKALMDFSFLNQHHFWWMGFSYF